MMNREMLRQAQQLQAKLAKAQAELEKATVTATSGGGAVTVVVSGQAKVVSIKISPEAVDPNDVGMLEDLVLTAVNEGLEKAKEQAANLLGSVTGMKLPPGLM